jgi:hypothetical protein
MTVPSPPYGRTPGWLVSAGTFQLLPELLVPDSWDQTLDAFVSPAGLTEF